MSFIDYIVNISTEYKNKNLFCDINFGTDNGYYYNTDIGEDNFLLLCEELSNLEWEKEFTQNATVFYYNDMMLIVSYPHKKQKCQKHKLIRKDIISGIGDLCINVYQDIVMPIDLFPCTTEYHDERKVSKHIFINEKYQCELIKTCNKNESIVYSAKVKILVNNNLNCKSVYDIIDNICKWLGNNDEKFNILQSVININHTSKLCASVIY